MLMMMFTSTSTDWSTFWQISDEMSLFISDVQEQNQENHGEFYQVEISSDLVRLVGPSLSFSTPYPPSLPPSLTDRGEARDTRHSIPFRRRRHVLP